MEEKFKLPSSSYEQLSKIIQGYAQINKPASLGDVSKRTGINTTVISGNNAFLMAIGALEGAKNKSSTLIGKKLGDALSHDLELEIQTILREIIEESEFLKNIVGAVRIRRGMDEGALKSHVAYTAGAPKSPSTTTGTGTIVELLKKAGAIEEKDGKFVVTSPTISNPPTLQIENDASDREAMRTLTNSIPLLKPNVTIPASGIQVSIDIKLDCKPSDLEGLGAKLKKLIAEFNDSDDA